MTHSMADVPSSTAPARANRWHRIEYLLEAVELGSFMLGACGVVTLVEHPAFGLRALLPDPTVRRFIIGVAMGLMVVLLVHSPWGKRSGAHMNPAVTLAFLRLGRIPPRDAVMYVCAQFIGASAGVWLSGRLLGPAIAHEAVNFVVTAPAAGREAAAFVAEFGISAGLMLVVLTSASSERLRAFTGVFCGLLVAAYITFEAPLSGMSMNPARSFGSAIVAGRLDHLWLYLLAPPIGMLGAADAFARLGRVRPCAKLRHDARVHCIFCSSAAQVSLPSIDPRTPARATHGGEQ
jgi:aquaporin Z